MLTTADLLAPLLSAIAAVRDGPQQVSPGTPVRVHLVPPSIDLQVPALMKGDVSLTFLTKSVRFVDALGVPVPDPHTADGPDLAGYLGDATKVVGGQPIAKVDIPLDGPPLKGAALPVQVANANPADLGTLPSLEEAAANKDNVLSGVPGQLGQLVGAIPVPVMAPVKLTVTWKVQRYMLENGKYKWKDVASSQDTWQLIGSGPDVQFVFAQLFEELTTAGPTIAHFQIIASVTLTVGTDSVGPVDLPPVPVDVPTIGIPSLAALFNTTQFGGADPGRDSDKAVMVLVPSNSPISDLTSLNDAVKKVTEAINGVLSSPLTAVTTAAQLAVFLTGLGRLTSAVTAYVGGAAKWPVQIVVGDGNDGVGDLSSVAYDTGITDIGDNFDDEVYSLILVAVPKVKLLLTTDDNYKGTKLTVETGPEMVLGVPSFDQGQLTNVIPPGVTGTAVPQGDTEDIEDGNFEAVRFVRS